MMKKYVARPKYHAVIRPQEEKNGMRPKCPV